ncbi:MAG: DUF4276 family protein [Magnetococcales bacterium]|nr:DUF4276 family protein [Magnetococcales bacterium]
MVNARLFIEGGGERNQKAKDLPIRMREAFRKFLICAGIPDARFTIVRCGSRGQVYQLFSNAVRDTSGTPAIPLLIVDSESEVAANIGPWTHLHQRDGWKKPPNCNDSHAHLMVQCMESWFLSDKKKISDYYGQGFQESSLPDTQPIEQALKKDILDGLSQASKHTTKKTYDKGSHSFQILERLDPVRVAQASPWACRLINTLKKILHLPINRPWSCTEAQINHPSIPK